MQANHGTPSSQAKTMLATACAPCVKLRIRIGCHRMWPDSLVSPHVLSLRAIASLPNSVVLTGRVRENGAVHASHSHEYLLPGVPISFDYVSLTSFASRRRKGLGPKTHKIGGTLRVPDTGHITSCDFSCRGSSYRATYWHQLLGNNACIHDEYHDSSRRANTTYYLQLSPGTSEGRRIVIFSLSARS